MKLIGVKTATITKKGQFAVPKELRMQDGFKDGKKIALLQFDDPLEIRPLNSVLEKLYPALASEKSLSKTWLTKEEDAAWKDL